MDTPTHSPSVWGILPSQRRIQIIGLGLQETPLKEVESQPCKLLCQGKRLKDVQPCWGASHWQCQSKLAESVGCTNVLGNGTPSQRLQKAALVLLEQEKTTVSIPRRETLWTDRVKDGTHPQCTVLFQLCRIG